MKNERSDRERRDADARKGKRRSNAFYRGLRSRGSLGVCDKTPTLDFDMAVDLFFMVRSREGRGEGIPEAGIFDGVYESGVGWVGWGGPHFHGV